MIRRCLKKQRKGERRGSALPGPAELVLIVPECSACSHASLSGEQLLPWGLLMLNLGSERNSRESGFGVQQLAGVTLGSGLEAQRRHCHLAQ